MEEKQTRRLEDIIKSPIKMVFFVIGGIFVGIALLVLFLGYFFSSMIDMPFANFSMLPIFVPMGVVFFVLGVGMIVLGIFSGKFIKSAIGSGMKLLDQDFLGQDFEGQKTHPKDYKKILSEGEILKAKVKANFQKFNVRMNGMPLNIINLEIDGKSKKVKTFNPHIARHFPEGKTVKVVMHDDLEGNVLPFSYLKK